MKNYLPYLTIFLFIYFNYNAFPQSPGPASQPMTAPGAIGINLYDHTLIWSNPLGVDYNEVYFSADSALVANSDPSVRIYNGYPSTVFNSALLNVYGPLNYNTKYFWRIVEHNSSGSSPSPLWYFKSRSPAAFAYECFFDTGFEGWVIHGPSGFTNWYWQNTSYAGGSPGEILFSWTPLFTGDSYVMSPEYPAAANSYMDVNFNYYEDYWSDTVVVGCAYTTDDGNNWTSIWEIQATGNSGPETIWKDLYIPGNFRLGFYYKGYSNNIDFYFIDNVGIYTPLTVSMPPAFLQAQADTADLKVHLQWNPGSSPAPITDYQIQRKDGLPTNTSSYVTITTTDSVTFMFDDTNVELNKNYTYRICTVSGPGSLSSYGNEATAYVPANVPVELTTFTGSYCEDEIILKWETATETNNQGFEILRSIQNDQTGWKKISFISGYGTTTEAKSYSFTDKGVTSGLYSYRLKQIDFDGSFKYSDIVEVEVQTPAEFSLEQNYPNPFNPSTKIKFKIPGQSALSGGNDNAFVTLKVYDILGNEIATLVNEERPAGTYEVEFNSHSDEVRSAKGGLSSGVYFYTLSTGNFFSTKKMVLLK